LLSLLLFFTLSVHHEVLLIVRASQLMTT